MKELILVSLTCYMITVFNTSLDAASKENIHTEQAQRITNKIYGELGLEFSVETQHFIINLIARLYTTPQETIFYATHTTQKLLEEQLKKSEAQLELFKKEETAVPYGLFLTIFALKHYIAHIKEYQNSFSLINQALFYIQHTSEYFLSLFYEPAIKQDQQIEDIGQQLYKYYMFELYDILHHYQRLLTFLHIKTLVDLPTLLDVWTTSAVQDQLKRRAKHLTHDIKVQFGVSALIDIALQAGIIAGSNLSTQWIDAADQKEYEKLVKEQQEITNQWDIFKGNLQQQQKEALKKLEQTFGDKRKELNEEYGKSSERLHQAIVYLNQSINLDQPAKRYLVQPISWDRYFESSPMYTPLSKIQPWFNIFGPFNESNWLFVPEHANFSQFNLTSLNTPFFWKQSEDQRNIFTNDPAGYSIFTEWATSKQSYEIEIDCVISKAIAPFFAGIIFNRGRWISGDPERLWWYRAFGIYASHENSPIKVGFAQQILKLPTTDDQSEKIISPLEQIMDTQDRANPTIPIKDITQEPLHCTFKISNQANKVSLSLIKKEPDKETTLFTQTIDNLDTYIFKYHGIGFIAAGCQASFTIKKPTELVYSKNVLEEFIKETKT